MKCPCLRKNQLLQEAAQGAVRVHAWMQQSIPPDERKRNFGCCPSCLGVPMSALAPDHLAAYCHACRRETLRQQLSRHGAPPPCCLPPA